MAKKKKAVKRARPKAHTRVNPKTGKATPINPGVTKSKTKPKAPKTSVPKSKTSNVPKKIKRKAVVKTKVDKKKDIVKLSEYSKLILSAKKENAEMFTAIRDDIRILDSKIKNFNSGELEKGISAKINARMAEQASATKAINDRDSAIADNRQKFKENATTAAVLGGATLVGRRFLPGLGFPSPGSFIVSAVTNQAASELARGAGNLSLFALHRAQGGKFKKVDLQSGKDPVHGERTKTIPERRVRKRLITRRVLDSLERNAQKLNDGEPVNFGKLKPGEVLSAKDIKLRAQFRSFAAKAGRVEQKVFKAVFKPFTTL